MGWPAFWSEILIVVLGVVIALAGNQAQAREQLARALAAAPNSELAGFYSQLSIVERRLGNAEAVVVGEKAFELNVLPGHIT
jgi:Tfp pilus assembly protein PilF